MFGMSKRAWPRKRKGRYVGEVVPDRCWSAWRVITPAYWGLLVWWDGAAEGSKEWGEYVVNGFVEDLHEAGEEEEGTRCQSILRRMALRVVSSVVTVALASRWVSRYFHASSNFLESLVRVEGESMLSSWEVARLFSSVAMVSLVNCENAENIFPFSLGGRWDVLGKIMRGIRLSQWCRVLW
jgi:hypothetical protein